MRPAAFTPLRADVTVVGAGAAGLFCALVAAAQGAQVTLVSRWPVAGSASYWAQGGIAAALGAGDSPLLHARDTTTAGRGACRRAAVDALCEGSPARVRELERMGVRFDTDAGGELALGLEGGHSRRRIAHADGAATGRRITERLAVLAAAEERVEILEHTTATALLVHEGRCTGVVADAQDASVQVASAATVLATGGSAALWERTTNPVGSVGVGLALAHSAGADLADLEFMQFHPTALVSSGERDGFLITEAVRGEGALLVDAAGERFVDELAPRDHVALAIEERLRTHGTASVGLDMRAVELSRFPNILEALRAEGIDPARETVPVAPAAHYSMGGVATDLDGRSTIAGLLAVGECACTGLHGANRLASNSLAECFVLSGRAALAANAFSLPAGAAGHAEPAALAAPPSQATKRALWRHAGLRRTAAGLHELAGDPFLMARLIAAAALAREESRGAHQRLDHPATDRSMEDRHVVLQADGAVRVEEWL
ncbi:MAG: L-aspartate oxidase [Thermoleophilaceae bacterium]